MKCFCGKREEKAPANASHVRDGHALCTAACAQAYDMTAEPVIKAIIEGGHRDSFLARSLGNAPQDADQVLRQVPV